MFKSLIISLLFFFVFLTAPSYLVAQELNNKNIKVGVYDNSPKVFVNEQGIPDGLFLDLVEAIAEKEKLKIEYVIGDWEELLIKLKNKEIDVLPDVAFSKVRDSLYTFNDISVLGSWLEVFTTKKTQIASVLDLNGKRIGVLKGSIQENYLNTKLFKDFNITYQIVTFSDYKGTLNALKKGDIDVLVAGRFFYFSDEFEKNILPTGIVFRPSELYFLFSKNSDPELVEIFDKNLSILKNDSSSSYYTALEYWLNRDFDEGFPRYIIWILVGVGIILLLITLFAFTLRYTVKLKTKELSGKNTELTVAKDRAEKSERLKTIFLQNMSHEIRTPMNAIIGFLEVLKDPNLSTEVQSKYINIVHTSANRLLSTLNSILQISKINSNEIEIHYSHINIDKIIDFEIDLFKAQAEEQGVSISKNTQVKGSKAVILTDKNMFNSILTNLLSNAIKFTQKGEIEIGNYIEKDKLVMYVKDSGVGIPEDRLGAIFERFVQADLDITRPHEGSGLGLSIVKAYVKILDGEIWVDSTIDSGSTFFFSIPYTPKSISTKTKPVRAKREQLPDKKLTILIAEDDTTSFMLLNQILKSDNNTIIRAENGRIAVDMVKENPNISIILMDIKMPELNGIEATMEIRKFNSEIPIIAQTAYTLSGDKEKAIEAGCDEYITKPINRNLLIRLIKDFTETVENKI